MDVGRRTTPSREGTSRCDYKGLAIPDARIRVEGEEEETSVAIERGDRAEPGYGVKG